MEFIKTRNGYLVKNGNGRIVSEKEKLQMENHELILKDIGGCNCQGETTKKIAKNKKRIKEIEKKEKETATSIENEVENNDSVEETTDTL